MRNATLLLILAGLFLVGIIVLPGQERSPDEIAGTAQNITIENGTQIVTVRAKGGYSPRVSEVQAGIPTILRVETRGTFDCSSALTIPQLEYGVNLAPSGVTDITIPPQPSGSVIQGLCSMGMYNFSLRFL